MGIVEIPVLKNMSVRYELTQDQAYYTSICLVRDLRNTYQGVCSLGVSHKSVAKSVTPTKNIFFFIPRFQVH
jgi:hypothetical protein